MNENISELEKALDSIKELIDHLQKSKRGIQLSEKAMDALKRSGGGPFAMSGASKPAATSPAGKTVEKNSTPDGPMPEFANLDELRNYIGPCQRCKLHTGRTKLVFGVGNPNAELMFIGEGPGRDEDIQGEPFVGAAGKLLTRMIESGLRKERSDVYIANIVKCRPPNNRDPEPDESAVCKQFLQQQIRLIKPKVICALGRIAAQNLLEVKTPISKLRGNWQEYMGIKVMPTFHPAALLRNPSNKRPVWEDLQMIMAELGWSQETNDDQ